MMLCRKYWVPVAAILPLIVLSGCWSAVELNERAFPRMMLLETKDTGIEMTLGIPLPQRMSANKPDGSSGSKEPFTYVTKSGASIGEAYRRIQSDLPRRITFGQLRHILLSQDFAAQGVMPFLDFFAREPRLHINANVYVTEGSAKQITKIPLEFETFPTDILTRYVKDRSTITATVKDFLRATYNGGDLIAPMLVFGREGALGKDAEHWLGTNGAALFRQGKMVGTLNTSETRGAMWIVGQLEDAEFDIPSPTDDKTVSVIVRRTTSQVEPQMEGDRIRYRVRCKGNGQVIATQSVMNFSDVNQMQGLEQRLNHALEERVTAAFDRAKEVKADAFHLGEYMRWRYPGKWNEIKKDWRQILATNVTVDPVVDITIKHFGSVRQPDWNRLAPAEETAR